MSLISYLKIEFVQISHLCFLSWQIFLINELVDVHVTSTYKNRK